MIFTDGSILYYDDGNSNGWPDVTGGICGAPQWSIGE